MYVHVCDLTTITDPLFPIVRIVKLSSPYLNLLIIVGAILFYIDVILFGIDENVASFHIVDVNCQASTCTCTHIQVDPVPYTCRYHACVCYSRLQYG